MPLALVLNGKPQIFSDLLPEATLDMLIRELSLKSDRVAVELNGEIVARALWNKTRLVEKDRIEVVHFVGGGSGILSSNLDWRDFKSR